MTSSYAALSRAELAVLVPELLLCGQLIDRSAMAWCIEAWGREEMAAIAIEEWSSASPIYTRRMQRTFGFEGTDVITIFKGLQLDIGAPPQFMDFRYTVHDRWHGEFHLDHCGALMDVEPLGPEYVRAMCHDIEDPTFDATAVATNPRAQVRPLHRPPRSSPDQRPHCAWTVIIDEAYPEVTTTAGCRALAGSRAATFELDPIVAGGEGYDDYTRPLCSDLDFAEFSHSALVRLADEVVLQMHLLNLGFVAALRRRAEPEKVQEISVKQLVGIAGLTARRLRAALDLPAGVEGALAVLAVHPLLNPAGYALAERTGEGFVVSAGPAQADGGWLGLCGPDATRALDAVVTAVDPTLRAEVTGTDQQWRLRVSAGHPPVEEFGEVAVTAFSTGAAFRFEHRRSLPITPVSR